MSWSRGRRALIGCVTTAALVGLSPGPVQAMRMGAPQPGEVVFATIRDGVPQIYAINDDGTHLHRLSSQGGVDSHPVFSPDGARIAFSSPRRDVDGVWGHAGASIWVMDANGSASRRLTDGTQIDVEPVWSPDGRHIAFTRVFNGSAAIWLMDADGRDAHRLTSGAEDAVNYRPAFAPDGRHLAFTSVTYDKAGMDNADIWMIGVDGRGVARLTTQPGYDIDPSFSPDGRQLAFTTGRDGNSEIYTMGIDGQGQRRLTDDPAVDTAAAYSPDGNRIVFSSNRRGGRGDLWIMETDGSGQSCLTTDAAGDTDPSWTGSTSTIAGAGAGSLAALPPPAGCLAPDPETTLNQLPVGHGEGG